jgi:DNA polymerase III gamma/tau subunit
MELYRKNRPDSLAGIVGNENAVKTLQSIVDNTERRPHTFLFVGPAGCGKTTLAFIMANAVGCKSVREQNSADYRGIDSVRELIEELSYAPLQGMQGIILEEAHRLTQDAQEALLKPVENCPEHTYLFFTTTDASKVNAALKTRMVIIQVEPLGEEQLAGIISDVAKKESIPLSDAVINHLAKSAYGSPRRALTMMEKVIGLSEEEQLKVTGYADETETAAIDICRIIVKGNRNWEEVAAILSSLTVEPEAVRRAVLGYLRAILLKKNSAKAFLIGQHFLKNYYDSGNAGLAFSCYGAWLESTGNAVS